MAQSVPITLDQIQFALKFRAKGRALPWIARELGVSVGGLSRRLAQHDRKLLAKIEPRRRRELCRQIERLEDVYEDSRDRGDLPSALKALAELRAVLRLDELDLTPKSAADEAQRTVIILPDNGRGREDDGTDDDEEES